MIANPEYQNQPKMFWAYVRTITQKLGYTVRNKKQIKIASIPEIVRSLIALGLDSTKLVNRSGVPTDLGRDLLGYFAYRAQVLNEQVQYQLMNADAAKELYEKLVRKVRHPCPIPMNKQTGAKAKPSYFTGIINMLIADSLGGDHCDYSPTALTTVTVGGVVVRTLSRRVDGAFPGVVNPIAIWEIKEYYYTTTFGSRIADSVYESMLDGMELEELRESEGIDIKHYLMVDAYETWWEMGRSYLCRMVDMLHMRYVDEILFGREVVDRLPVITREWKESLASRSIGKQ